MGARTPELLIHHVSQGQVTSRGGTFVSKGHSHPTPTIKSSEEVRKGKGEGRLAPNKGAL